MRTVVLLVVAAILFAGDILSQPTLEPGDVLVSGFTVVGSTGVTAILVYGADGVFKRQFVQSDQVAYFETLFHNGVVIAGTDGEVQQFAATGAPLPRFSNIRRVDHFAPAINGDVVASNGSGQLYRFRPDGSVRAFRDTVILFEATALGVDLAPDQCSVHIITPRRLAVWDSCLNTAPQIFGPLRSAPTGNALRLLRDGTFLAAYRTDIAHLDSEGNVIRTYGIPASAVALATDGTSFWTNGGSTLLNVDIATGAILLSVNTGYGISYLSVVGEPRASLTGAADIPASSTILLGLLACCFAIVAAVRLR